MYRYRGLLITLLFFLFILISGIQITLQSRNLPRLSSQAATCDTKITGDANCDGKTSLVDFEIWRKEFLTELVSAESDFNADEAVNLSDFEIWRTGWVGDATPTPSLSPTMAVSDPLELFKTNFLSKDYKVPVSGQIQYSPTETPFTYPGVIYYYRQGHWVRIDTTDQATNEKFSYIYKENLLYILDHTTKTYYQIDAQNDTTFGQQLYTLLEAINPLNELVNNAGANTTTWNSIAANTWETDWRYRYFIISYDENVSYPTRITLSGQSNLITRYQVKPTDILDWQTLSYTYEQIANIDSLLTIPADYVYSGNFLTLKATSSLYNKATHIK